MKARQSNNRRFKDKGSNILQASPTSVSEFLNDTTGEKDSKDLKNECVEKQVDTFKQNRKTGIAQLQKAESCHESHKYGDTENLERLHVQIRKDLADKLFATVFKLKCDRTLKKGRASQRWIVEKALEEYFEKHAQATNHS